MDWFCQKIVRKINTNNGNALIVSTGRQGSGKSWGNGRIIERLQQMDRSLRFKPDNIVYWTDPLIDKILESRKDIILIDETIQEWSRELSQMWTIQNHIFTVINTTQRFRQNVMLIVTQARRNLNPRVWSMADWYLKFIRPSVAIPYYNNEDPMSDLPHKREGDFYVYLDIPQPTQKTINILEAKAVEFKNEVMHRKKLLLHPQMTMEQIHQKELQDEKRRLDIEYKKLRMSILSADLAVKNSSAPQKSPYKQVQMEVMKAKARYYNSKAERAEQSAKLGKRLS